MVGLRAGGEAVIQPTSRTTYFGKLTGDPIADFTQPGTTGPHAAGTPHRGHTTTLTGASITLRTLTLTVFGCALLAATANLGAEELLGEQTLLLSSDGINLHISQPAINDAGDIVFVSGKQGLFAGNGTPLVLHGDEFEDQTASQKDGTVIRTINQINRIRNASLNNSGSAVFAADFSVIDAKWQGAGVFTLDGTLLVASGDTVAGKTIESSIHSVSINKSGDLVFTARFSGEDGKLLPEGQGVFNLTSDTLLIAAGDVVAGKTIVEVWEVDINDFGEFVVNASFHDDEDTQIKSGIFTSAGNLLAASGYTLSEGTIRHVWHPSINNAGDVVFAASLTEDGEQGADVKEGVFTADGTSLAVSGDLFAGKTLESVWDPAINNLGDVVFVAPYEQADESEKLLWSQGLFLLKAPSVPEEETPGEMLVDLIEDVESINLDNGISSSLDAKLENAVDAFLADNAEQREDAVNKLEAFIKSVEAQKGKKISEDEADYLVESANKIITNAKK
jgi:hypothetical protein